MSFLPLLALGFASPLLLWGLALGTIPIIIHLLHKRKFRETQWAAMQFLLEATRKNSRRIRLEQLLLLSVRVLILVLLALALARPYMETFGTYFQADVPTHRILVVDASLSMGYQPGESSRFDQAQATARKIASAARQGDALNLVRIADSPPRAVVRQPAYQKSQVISEIDQLQLTEERGDLVATLKEVTDLLSKAPEIKRKEIYFISDFQRDNWSPEAGDAKANLRRLLDEMSRHAEVAFIDLGRENAANAAITSFGAEEPFITVGRPVHLQATLRNFGGMPLSEQALELYVNDRLVERQRVDLAPDTDTRTDFSYTFQSGGEHRLELRLEGDALAVDDRRWLSLPVKEELNVLLVNGKQAGRPEDNATFYLEQALSPSTERRRWQGFTRPRVIQEGELTRTDLSRYDCVFLCNVRLFTEREAEILRAYVGSGGGLVFCLGDQVRAENYNLILHRDGEGILPAKLGERVGNAQAPEHAFEFDTGDLTHPIVSQFRGNPGAGLETTITFEYFQAEVPDDSRASVALRFAPSGDPVIVDAPLGRGRSILITTPVGVAWGTWAGEPSFPPMMHETVQHAVAGRWSERQRLVGEPLARAFPTRTFGMPVTLKRPDGSQQPLRLSEGDDFASITYDETDRSGLYEVTLGAPLNRKELFAVNVDTRESDLAKVDEHELRSELLPGVDFTYRTHWEDVARETEADVAVAERGGLTRWLLLAVLGLVFIELLMAWKFYYGFLVLSGVLAAVFVGQVLAWNTPIGMLLTLVFLAGIAVVSNLSRRTNGRVPSAG